MKMVETAKLIKKNWGIVNMKPRSMNLQISNRKYAKLKKNIFGFPMKSCIFSFPMKSSVFLVSW